MSERSPAAVALARKIEDRSAVIAVVGLGYVGLPLARVFHDAGFRVVGYDRDEAKIARLAAGENYLKHLGADLAARLRASGRFTPTVDPDTLRDADAILLCVPSPLGRHGEPDMSYIHDSTRMVAQRLRPGQLVSLESTTYPGTTRGECLPILAESGLVCGEQFFLAFSPEREDPGRKDHDTRTIPKLVGGVDPASGEIAHRLYGAAVAEAVLCDSAEIAEAAKILENVYRAVNIALVNELKPVLMSMGIDIWKVIAAAATKPFGFQPFYPGPGWGGHCIPIDPFYLTWKAREFGHHTRFIELAGEINHAMPRFVVQRVVHGLNQLGRAARGAKVLVAGIAYKPDVDDVRETPAAEIVTQLRELGADVSYHDPHVPIFPQMRRYPFDFDLTSVPLTVERVASSDVVLVVTHHAAIDWDLIAEHARLVVDTRNVMAGRKVRGLLVPA
ncbi:MAG TPA: nucleotide sugar dehydrogenase [Planctomycetota bacterium]|nr:nucleotide sugar dehydrogenase [Planctomycetota bacterium]